MGPKTESKVSFCVVSSLWYSKRSVTSTKFLSSIRICLCSIISVSATLILWCLAQQPKDYTPILNLGTLALQHGQQASVEAKPKQGLLEWKSHELSQLPANLSPHSVHSKSRVHAMSFQQIMDHSSFYQVLRKSTNLFRSQSWSIMWVILIWPFASIKVGALGHFCHLI